MHSSAFLPRAGELSTFQTQNLDEEQTWDLGLRHVVQPGRRLHGRADNSPTDYLSQQLTLIADDDPPGHVNVVDWPEEKEAQKEIAVGLARLAKTVPCTPPRPRS